MIELYSWPTPNGLKVSIFLEEAGIDHKVFPVNIGKGEQFDPAFLKIAPNNRIPAIIDNAPTDGGAPISLFESGAILLYLAEKTGQFIPTEIRARASALEWLFWQMGGLGPMTGQYGHFHVYAPEEIDYARERYKKEVHRLYGVMEERLANNAYLAGEEYSIADMACYPWINVYDKAPLDLESYPNLLKWQATIRSRPAVQKVYATRDEIYGKRDQPMSDEEKKLLFGIDKK